MIRCAACGHILSAELTPVDDNFEPLWSENEQLIPPGRFWANSALAQYGTAEVLTIHVKDGCGMVIDRSRTQGCCGNSEHVITHRCARCLAPVGTEIDDCYTGLYLYFRADAAMAGEPTAEAHELWDLDLAALDCARATIYRRGPSLFFVASCSRSRTGAWFEHEVLFPHAALTMSDLAHAAMQAFAQSSFDVDTPNATDFWDDIARRAGVSTTSQFMRGTVAVDIAQTINAVTVSPTRNRGPVALFDPLPELAIRCDADDLTIDERLLAEAIVDALDLAE